MNVRGLERGINLQFRHATSKPYLNDTVYNTSELLVSALKLARTGIDVM